MHTPRQPSPSLSLGRASKKSSGGAPNAIHPPEEAQGTPTEAMLSTADDQEPRPRPAADPPKNLTVPRETPTSRAAALCDHPPPISANTRNRTSPLSRAATISAAAHTSTGGNTTSANASIRGNCPCPPAPKQ
jgi:hypothetical protein